MRIVNNLIVIIATVSALSVNAGLWDSIKKVGAGVVDVAENAASITVNAMTSTVQSVKSEKPSLAVGNPQTQIPATNDEKVTQTTSHHLMPGRPVAQKKTITQEDDRKYVAERTAMERRFAEFQCPKLSSVSECNDIRNRLIALKGRLSPLPHSSPSESEVLSFNKLLEDEVVFQEHVKKLVKREDEKRADAARREKAERLAYEKEQERRKAEERELERKRKERAERLAYENEQERRKAEERELERKRKERAEELARRRAGAAKRRRNVVIKAHEILAAAHAKAAGSPEGYEFKPISVFRNVKLGMTVEEVCAALEIKDAKKFLDDASEYKEWIGGKAKKVTLKAHTLYLQFARIVDGDYPQFVLVTAQMEFNDKDNAPEPKVVCDKYAQIPGVKVTRIKEKHGEKFRDGTPKFWKVVYWNLSGRIERLQEIERQNERYNSSWSSQNDASHNALKAKLEGDEKAIRADVIEDEFREVDVFDVDGMRIQVKPNQKTKLTSYVAFEDCVISKILVKIKEDAEAGKEKAKAEAKAAAEKKAKADTLDF